MKSTFCEMNEMKSSQIMWEIVKVIRKISDVLKCK